MPIANAYDAFLAVALHTSLEDAQAMHALHTARELRGRYSSAPPAPLRVPCGVRLGSFPLRLTFEAPHTHTNQARR